MKLFAYLLFNGRSAGDNGVGHGVAVGNFKNTWGVQWTFKVSDICNVLKAIHVATIFSTVLTADASLWDWILLRELGSIVFFTLVNPMVPRYEGAMGQYALGIFPD